ncbi:nuclear transport factor 2 family protein [Paenibacillus oralis]|uniref:Nuclear transport factor 2 family protein n=1 Tax=Paenibacillus oralis TaxID=2490856 RepID=A0A3P3UCB5_9BACL|nr:nuclear transport factor 2 family protein [Paenibacillus oralis]RRJ67268.1 nuclear transport factor 2 family protein [Paenibacillus oralis]
MDKAQIIANEELLRTAMLSGNVELLDELIADDLIFVNQFGQTLSKESDIEAHRSGNLKLTQIDIVDQKIKLLDAVAVTITQVTIAGTFGTPFQGDFCYTRVWQYRMGKWKIVSGHCSSIT